MIHLKPQLLIFIAVVLERSVFADLCPPKEDITPCTCQNKNDGAYATCNGLRNAQELTESVAGFKGRKINFLKIQHSNLGDVPGYAFKGTHFEEIRIRYSNMTSIGDDEFPAFSGLENSLESLMFINVFEDYEKPLTKPIKLGHLKELTEFYLKNNIIPELEDEWFRNGPVSLIHLNIEAAHLKKLGPKAFSALRNLGSLALIGNTVTPQRSMLPDNSYNLNYLFFSENEIVDLPSDMFFSLPSLFYIYLPGNRMEHIHESTFKTILRQLIHLDMESNPLNCGPKMKWIFENNLQGKVSGTCASPCYLKGRSIRELTSDDICE